MSEPLLLKLRLSLMGRPVRNFTFDKPVVSVGRDPAADVFVDNPGISRDHFRMERTTSGEYQVVDLGSANGTFVNDQAVNTAVIRNNDVVRFGKYTLWVGYETDRRTLANDTRRPADAEQHTVILSRTELGHLLETQKEKELSPPPAPPAALSAGAPSMPQGASPANTAPPAPPAANSAGTLVVTFLLGAVLGAGAMYLLLPR